MKVVFVVGPPCVGKSTIARKVLDVGVWQFKATKFIPHHVSGGVAVLGRYDEPHQFPGTDRMSMAAQPHVIEWIRTCGFGTVVIEGDRLGNTSMIAACSACCVEVINVIVEPSLLAQRREQRDQSDTFIRSRETKVSNILRYCRDHNILVTNVLNNHTGVPALTATHILSGGL